MKTTTTTTLKTIIGITTIGLFIYGLFDFAKIILDGRAMIYDVFMNSLQERIVLFPKELAEASLKLFVFCGLAFFITGIYIYLSIKERTTEENKIKSVESFAPGREADFLRWKDAYYLVIVPFLQLGKNETEIAEELKKRRLPFSKYLEIRKAGDAGELKEFKKK